MSSKTETESVVYVSVEGNIGSGKSSVMRSVAKHFDDCILFCEEPVNDWGLLEYMYRDPTKYAFAFEVQVLTSKYHKWINALDECRRTQKRIVVMERSPLSAYKVFTRMMRERGTISSHQYHIYTQIFAEFQPQLKSIDHIVHIDTRASTCQVRAGERNRKAEEALSLEYLLDVESHTNNYVRDHSSVYTIDGDRSREHVAGELTAFLSSLRIGNMTL